MNLDYLWLGFFIVGVLGGLWIVVDEFIEGHRRTKNPEDWQP